MSLSDGTSYIGYVALTFAVLRYRNWAFGISMDKVARIAPQKFQPHRKLTPNPVTLA